MTTPDPAALAKAEEILDRHFTAGQKTAPFYGNLARDIAAAIAAKDAEIARLEANARNMAAALEWLDRRGGLGYDAHDRITAALADYRAAPTP